MSRADADDGVESAFLDQRVRLESERLRHVDGGRRGCAGRKGGLKREVERESLHRIVRVTVRVQEAPEPSGPEPGAVRADLPVVPRGEVREVRHRVSDAGKDAE